MTRNADRKLTPLGEALEDARLATRETTNRFLSERGLTPNTWYRLLYGGPVPLTSTIVRYSSAAGLDPQVALELARRSSPTGQSGALRSGLREITALGAALEARREALGLDTRPLLDSRNLSATTWYRLLHGTGSPPTALTVIHYAEAVGMDPDEAIRLAEQDRRSGRHAPRTAPGRPPAS